MYIYIYIYTYIYIYVAYYIFNNTLIVVILPYVGSIIHTRRWPRLASPGASSVNQEIMSGLGEPRVYSSIICCYARHHLAAQGAVWFVLYVCAYILDNRFLCCCDSCFVQEKHALSIVRLFLICLIWLGGVFWSGWNAPRHALEAGGPWLQGAYPSRHLEWIYP